MREQRAARSSRESRPDSSRGDRYRSPDRGERADRGERSEASRTDCRDTRRYARRAKPYDDRKRDSTRDGQSTFTPSPSQRVLTHEDHLFATEQPGELPEDIEGWERQQQYPGTETRALVVGVRRLKRSLFRPFRLLTKGSTVTIDKHSCSGGLSKVPSDALRDVLRHQPPSVVQEFRKALLDMCPALMGAVLRELKSLRSMETELEDRATFADEDPARQTLDDLEREVAAMAEKAALMRAMDRKAQAVVELKPTEVLEADIAHCQDEIDRTATELRETLEANALLQTQASALLKRLCDVLAAFER